MQGLLPPEERVALVKVVVVEPYKGVTLFGREGFADGFAQYADARMIHVGVVRIFHKQHVTDELHQSVANPDAALVASLAEGLGHLALCVVVGFQVVEPVGLAHQEIFADELGMNAKQTLHEAVVDEGPCKKFLAEGQSEPAYLLGRQRQCRREVAQQAIDGIAGNLPDAEKAQYVVNAERIEILAHVDQTAVQEELGVGLLGLFPIVRWKSPVLPPL